MTTILILDDRPTNREFLGDLLDGQGYHVVEAAHGDEALDLARKKKPALIISDVVMPRMDGFEFVRRLRHDPNLATTEVIFYTAAYVELEARRLAQACGVEHLLHKPCEPEIILQTVATVLGDVRASAPAVPNVGFAEVHSRLLTDKLAQKVDELEALNAALEDRVTARTTELAAANARLRELHQMKDQFLAVVSHDLRSPLSGVLLAAELMVKEGDAIPAGMRKHFLANITDCIKQQLFFVNEMLELARHDETPGTLAPTALRVSDLLGEALAAIALNADAKQLARRVSLPPDEPLVQADRTQLRQVFNNLLTNAIKFTPAGGQIAAEVEVRGESIRVRITDTGIGIPPADLPHLFEKFTTHHRTGTTGESGSGLGLAIVGQIVERHGGTVTVESRENLGTAFIVDLPVRRPPVVMLPQAA